MSLANTPYNPQSKAESFAQLIAQGMDADRAFVVLAVVTANTQASVLDAQHMAEIRELARVYAEYTGQESLLITPAPAGRSITPAPTQHDRT